MTKGGESERRHGWFVMKRDGSRTYFDGGSANPSPEPPHKPSPTVVRMFVDDVSGIGLWSGGALFPNELPLSPELAAEVQAWVDEWTDDFDAPNFDEVAHDWRGLALSLRVQGELGGNYRVKFLPQSKAVRRALKTEKAD